MAPKRPAAPKAKAQAPAKKAKVVSTEEEALATVTSFLKEFKRAPHVETLLAALPFAAATPKATRHPYQEGFLEAVRHFLAEVEASKRGAVSAAETALGQEESDRGGVAAQLADAEGKVQSLAAAVAQTGEAAKAAEDAAGAAKAALDSEKMATEKIAQDLQDLEAEKTKYASGFADFWIPLKAGTHEGKSWKEKEKTFKKVALLLHDQPESLLGALQAALKEAPSARGEFANKAVQAAEDELKKASQGIEDKIAALTKEAEGKKAAIAQAAGKLTAAEAAAATASEASIEAQNAWADATNAVEELKGEQNALSGGGRAKELETAKAGLARVVEALGKLAILRDPPPPATEPADEPVAAQ